MKQGADGYVFVVTYGRSGSTLLQTLLQSIDGYFIRGENANALWPLFQSIQRIAQAKQDHGYREIEAKGPWFGINKVDPATYARHLVGCFVDDIIQPPADARVVGFKEIRFHEVGEDFQAYLDFIAEQLAPARFIFNKRNWRDVAKSGWWKNCEESLVRDIVTKADDMFDAYADKYPERCFVAKYEDYVGKPDYWRALFDFLGETYDPVRVNALCSRQLKH